MKKRIYDLIIKSVIIMFFILLCMIDILVIFFAEKIGYVCKMEFLLGNIYLLIIGICIMGVFCFCKKNRRTIQKNDIIIASVLLFFFEIFVSYHIAFLPGWDVGVVLSDARKISIGDTETLSNFYFSMYPNNLLLTGIFAIILKIGKSFGCLIFFQCLLYSLTGYLVFELIYEYTKKCSMAWLGWGMYFISVGTSAWFVVPYSDSMGIIFPIVLLYVYKKMHQNKEKIPVIIAFFIISFIGYHIKPQTVIVSIAIVLVEILNIIFYFSKNKFKLCVTSILIMCMVFNVGEQLLNLWTNEMGYEIDEEMEFEWPHYFMMGLNAEYEGIYSPDDVEFSISFSTRKDRKKANIQKAKERIKNFRIDGLTQYIFKKALVNFADGTFLFGIEGGENFCLKMEPEKNALISPFLRNIFLKTGKYYYINACIKHMVWILILFFSIGNIFTIFNALQKKQVTKEKIVLLTAIIGFIIFQMLFEARSRYMIVYVPIFIICAVNGVSEWEEFIRSRKFGVFLKS